MSNNDGAEDRRSRAVVPPNGSMETLFGKVWDVLVRHAGALETGRTDFVRYHAQAASLTTNTWWIQEEWRFMGSLGMGGKFYCEPDSFRVGCYSEDRNFHRTAVCASTNEALRSLHIEFSRLRRGQHNP